MPENIMLHTAVGTKPLYKPRRPSFFAKSRFDVCLYSAMCNWVREEKRIEAVIRYERSNYSRSGYKIREAVLTK